MKKWVFVLPAVFAFYAISGPEASAGGGPTDPISKGTWTINIGVGPATHWWGNGYGFGPGFKFGFENGVAKLGPGTLTVGGELGLSFFAYTYYADYRESWVNFIMSAKVAYHYGFDVKGLDVYGGVPLGFGFTAYTDHYTNELYHYNHGYSAAYPYFGIFFGASYFFGKVVGINGEFGYNITYANLGVVFRVK